MPTATLDHQDGAGLPIPRQNGEPDSNGSNLTASTSYGLGSGIYGSPENSTTTFALTTGKIEVCRPKKLLSQFWLNRDHAVGKAEVPT